jgi:hypothetical protein
LIRGLARRDVLWCGYGGTGLWPVSGMEKVYSMTELHEILKEKVAVEEKIFSIYGRHTGIIVKGQGKYSSGTRSG